MKSVDKLRELGSQYHDRIIFFKEEFDKCLDAIEEEGRTRYGTEYTDELYQFARRVEVAANDRDDVTLFGVDYTPLPVDADGVPWHINDEFEVDEGIAHVNGIGDNRLYYIDNDGMQWTRADNKRHHHAPTVEDVLREFADEVQRCCDTEDTIAEYAARLRLAGDE